MKRQRIATIILCFISLASIPLPGVYKLPVQYITMLCIIYWWIRTRKLYPKNYHVINLYLAWAVLGIIRGLCICSIYTEYRNLAEGFLDVLLPLMVWLFYEPSVVRKIYRNYLFPVLFLLILLLSRLLETPLAVLGYSFTLLFPLSLFLMLLSQYKKKWQFIIIALGTTVVVYTLVTDNKFICASYAFALLFGYCSKLRIFNDIRNIRRMCYCCYAFAIFIFTFILIDVGNVFIKGESKDAILYKNYLTQGKIDDTRSLIYIDVINSAIDNNYVLFGHTPARGNKVDVSSILFLYAYEGGMDSLSFIHGERHGNEASFLNIFTWLGLVGLILYSMIYFKASYLAIAKSNNKYVKFFGCMVGSYWSLSFIGAINEVNLINLGIWTFLGVCYSDKFRRMSNEEFNLWAKSIFYKKIK